MKALILIFLRCSAAPFLGLSLWNTYLFKSGATASFGLQERVVIPSLGFAFALTLTHFVISKMRGVKTDFAVRQQALFAVPDQPVGIAAAVSLISRAKKWELVEKNSSEAVFKSRFNSLFSFGEVIRLKLEGNQATVSSKPLFPLTAADFGQNFLNVKSVADLLASPAR